MTFDTRGKILSIDQARAAADDLRGRGEPVIAFVSPLEVFRAEHVRKLASLPEGTLFVILTEPETPLVPLDARAEVAAGLRRVDYVIPASEGPAAVLAAISPTLLIDDTAEDRERTSHLMEHVRRRARN